MPPPTAGCEWDIPAAHLVRDPPSVTFDQNLTPHEYAWFGSIKRLCYDMGDQLMLGR